MELQWELMIFTLFVCLSAGIFAVQGTLALMNKGAKAQLPCLIVSLVSLAIGGIGSFLHLQHWERIFNGFGHLTSGITQELIAIVVFGIVLVVYFFMMRRHEELPEWLCVVAIIVSVVLVIVMSHSYNMAARPVWDTPLLWLYYLANAGFFGALAVMAIAEAAKGADTCRALLAKVALIAGIVQAVVTAIYVGFFMMASSAYTEVGNYFDPTMPTKAMEDPTAALSGVVAGDQALLFWLGVVVVGLLVPIVLAFLA
ncbi:MAG: DmsC/YnfH family molybdoenzyme membrane anchor subunit, partial [Raoultibacter sp.]